MRRVIPPFSFDRSAKARWAQITAGLILVAVFAYSGASLMKLSHADTSLLGFEAEAGMVAGNTAPGDTVGASGGTSVRFGGTDTPGGTATYPADVFDMSKWKLQLPVADGPSSVVEIMQPKLATYSDNYFHLNADKTAVVFHVNHGGATTSGSSNPRSELREMTGTDGKTQASWPSTSGTHTMTVKLKITHLTTVKPQVVVGQIHDGTNDISVFRLEGTNLWISDENTLHAYLVTANYQLGTVFTYKYEVSGGVIKYYYNGQLLPFTESKDISHLYFKAGNYLQSNPDSAPGESTSAYSEVEIYDVQVTHQ